MFKGVDEKAALVTRSGRRRCSYTSTNMNIIKCCISANYNRFMFEMVYFFKLTGDINPENKTAVKFRMKNLRYSKKFRKIFIRHIKAYKMRFKIICISFKKVLYFPCNFNLEKRKVLRN